jgi:hypothetical protein
MLKKDPNERYNKALEIIIELERIKLAEEQVQERQMQLEQVQEHVMDTS